MRLQLVYRYLPALTAHFDVTLIVSHDERRLKLNQNGYQFFSTASCTVTRAMFYSDVKNNVYKGKYCTQFKLTLLVAVELSLHFLSVDKLWSSALPAKYFENQPMPVQNYYSQ